MKGFLKLKFTLLLIAFFSAITLILNVPAYTQAQNTVSIDPSTLSAKEQEYNEQSSLQPMTAIQALDSSTQELDNGIPEGTIGRWSVIVQTGGESRSAQITAHRQTSNDTFTENVLYDYFTYIDTEINGGGIQLSSANASLPVRDPGNPNVVTSSGFFVGQNGNTIDWTVSSSIAEGKQTMTNRYAFTSRDGGQIGKLRLLQYLDEDVESFSDDVFLTKGASATSNLELLTLDDREVYGIGQSGLFRGEPNGLTNAVFAGWAADIYNNMKQRITGAGQSVSWEGIIANLPDYTHPTLGAVRGPRDIVSVLAWDISEDTSEAVVVTSLWWVTGSNKCISPSQCRASWQKNTIWGH